MMSSLFKLKTVFVLAALLTALTLCASCSRGDLPAPEGTARQTKEAIVITEPTALPTEIPTPAPTEEPYEERVVREALESMTLDEKLGQMLLFGVSGKDEPGADSAALLSEFPVGNLILNGANIKKNDGFTAAGNLLRSINEKYPLDVPRLTAIDVEGGSVVRFDWEPEIPSALELGTMDPDEVRSLFRSVGERLVGTGIRLDLAPVYDAAEDPSASFMGDRIISPDIGVIKTIGGAVIEGLREAGCLSCAKHFPGHGGTDADSHETTPTVLRSREELMEYDIAAFAGAIDSGVDCVMTAHVLYPALDPENVATLSPVIITDVLRGELGFGGVVISDDMLMAGVGSGSDFDPAIGFIKAGGDMLLCAADTARQREIIRALRLSVDGGILTVSRIDESVGRILRLKLKAGVWQP